MYGDRPAEKNPKAWDHWPPPPPPKTDMLNFWAKHLTESSIPSPPNSEALGKMSPPLAGLVGDDKYCIYIRYMFHSSGNRIFRQFKFIVQELGSQWIWEATTTEHHMFRHKLFHQVTKLLLIMSSWVAR